MRHSATKAFWQKYRGLPPEIRARADRQFSLLKANPQHPSLQFKKLGQNNGLELWSARARLSYRALAIKRPSAYLWFCIGDHDSYDLLLSP